MALFGFDQRRDAAQRDRLLAQAEAVETKLLALDAEKEDLRRAVAAKETEISKLEVEYQGLQSSLAISSSAAQLVLSQNQTVSSSKNSQRPPPPRTPEKTNSPEQITYGVENTGKRKRKRLSYSAAYPAVHPNFPMILIIEGDATAVSCIVCGAHAERRQPPFSMPGMNGLFRHMQKSHPRHKESKTIEATEAGCRRNVLSDGDFERVRNGLMPLDPELGPIVTRDAMYSESLDAATSDQREASTFVGPTLLNAKGPKHLQEINKNYRIVLYEIDAHGQGAWMSFTCVHCGCNARLTDGKASLFAGLVGLRVHVNGGCRAFKRHQKGEKTLDDFRRTPIAPDVAARMLEGRIVPGAVECVVYYSQNAQKPARAALGDRNAGSNSNEPLAVTFRHRVAPQQAAEAGQGTLHNVFEAQIKSEAQDANQGYQGFNSFTQDRTLGCTGQVPHAGTERLRTPISTWTSLEPDNDDESRQGHDAGASSQQSGNGSHSQANAGGLPNDEQYGSLMRRTVM